MCDARATQTIRRAICFPETDSSRPIRLTIPVPQYHFRMELGTQPLARKSKQIKHLHKESRAEYHISWITPGGTALQVIPPHDRSSGARFSCSGRISPRN